jgi:hypothetical protein
MPWLSRTLVAAGLVAALGAVPATPASATGAGAFTGTVHINCFGCGLSGGTGHFTLDGTGAPFVASFTVNEPASTCPAIGTAEGTFSGAVNGRFTWTRYGTYLDIRTNGLPGSGHFVITSPVGNPCGGPVAATVTGTIAF